MLEAWCGDQPCHWDAQGVERVGTWHPNDYGAALVADDAQLSQFDPHLTEQNAPCLAFSFVAQIEERASVWFELDVLDDGTRELSVRVPPSEWERRTFTVHMPTWYRGVRFIIRKDGPGRAVVAELDAEVSKTCAFTPLALSDRPAGASCDTDAECTSESCTAHECMGRSPSAACDAGACDSEACDAGACDAGAI